MAALFTWLNAGGSVTQVACSPKACEPTTVEQPDLPTERVVSLGQAGDNLMIHKALNIGAPGEIEGAAGSLYVEVPVQVYGRLRSGEPFNMLGPVRLRRCNQVPGCTDEQRRWRIADSGVRPRPAR